jgi:hypothetical protein
LKIEAPPVEEQRPALPTRPHPAQPHPTHPHPTHAHASHPHSSHSQMHIPEPERVRMSPSAAPA